MSGLSLADLEVEAIAYLLVWSSDRWLIFLERQSLQGKLNKVIQRAKAHIAANRVKKLDEVINNS